MSELLEIKTRIYDEELIEQILESLECEYIDTEQNGNLYVAQLPQRYLSSNKRAIQIKNRESLTSYIRNKGILSPLQDWLQHTQTSDYFITKNLNW